MNPADAEQIEQIFAEALDMPPGPRTTFITERCARDPVMIAQVRALLHDALAAGGKFLDPNEIRQVTAGAGEISGLGDEVPLPLGTTLQAYTIRGVLGVGGMGIVYRADQDRPRRTVALKVIRRGLGTQSILRRFEHEAEILGRLQHLGIAQIYEAGTATLDGQKQPFIAMELVEGVPLTAYSASKNLGTDDRLRLIADVCDALHHAHQRGVIHRDLKPANILVSAAGVPKILDFGVARAVQQDLALTTLRTHIGQLIGTLAYMSPEQVTGNPAEIDVRSDVYSLGVVLFELLAGRLPREIAGRSLPDAIRIIRDGQPSKLSQHSRVFRGDIDTIVHKALETDLARRFQSAAEFGDDIRRHLAGEPIHARQDSALYVLRKQLRRYRWAILAAVVFIIGLISFAVHADLTARSERILAKEASAARTEAILERDTARATNARLVAELRQSVVNQGRMESRNGNTPLAEDLLWRSYIENPDWLPGRWALWELYIGAPTRWSVQALADPMAGNISPDAQRIVLIDKKGTLAFCDSADGHEIARRAVLAPGVSRVAFTADGSACVLGFTKGQAMLVPVDASAPATNLGEGPVHVGGVLAVAASPNGKLLATAGGDKMIRLWDAVTLAPVRAWKAHNEPVILLAFSPDSGSIASAGRVRTEDGVARVWSVESGTMTGEFTLPEVPNTSLLYFTSDRASLLVGSGDRCLFRCNLKTGAILPIAGDFGSIVASSGENPTTGELIIADNVAMRLLGPASLSAAAASGRFRSPPFAIAWTAPARAVMVSDDGVISAMDLRTEPALTRLDGFSSWCFGADFSPGGDFIAIAPGLGAHRTMPAIISIKDPSRRTVVAMEDSKSRSRCVRFLPDSKSILLGSADGALRLVDAASGEITAKMAGTPGEVYALEINHEGTLAASGHTSGLIRIWNLETRKMAAECPKVAGRVEGLAFSPDGSLLVSASITVGAALWNPSTGESLGRLDTTAPPWNVTFSPDGKTLLTANRDGSIDVFDVSTRSRRATIQGHGGLVCGVRFAPDGKTFATGGTDGVMKLWDSVTLREMLALNPGGTEIIEVTFDRSGRYLAGTTARSFTAIYDLGAMDSYIDGNAQYQRGRLIPEMPSR